MQQLLEKMGVVKSTNGDNFNWATAVTLFVLLLAFIGSTFYILVSSLQ